MTDSKRDDLDKILQYWMDDDPKLNVNAYINIMNWHNRKLREEMLALLPGKRKGNGRAKANDLSDYFNSGYNDCIDEIRKKIEEKYK